MCEHKERQREGMRAKGSCSRLWRLHTQSDNILQIHVAVYVDPAVCRLDGCVEDDGSLAGVCVVIGTEEVVPTEA